MRRGAIGVVVAARGESNCDVRYRLSVRRSWPSARPAVRATHSVRGGCPVLLLVVVGSEEPLCCRLVLHLHRFLLISFVECGFLGAQPETSGNVGCIAEQIIAQSY